MSNLEPNSRILNVGGSLIECSHFCNLGFYVVDIDLSSNMTKHIKKHDPRVNAIQANIKDFVDEKFDGIWACRSLIHIPPTDMPTTLINITKLLKNDGICGMIFFTTNEESHQEQLNAEEFTTQQEIYYYRTLYPLKELKKMFERIGAISKLDLCTDSDGESTVYIEIKK